MSLEELRARVLASMKKKEEAELEEGEVPAPPPPPPSAPTSAPPLPHDPPPPPPPMNSHDERFVGERERARTRSPSYADPSWRTPYPKQLDDAWETDDQPYYEPRDYRGRPSRSRGAGPRGRGRGAGWPKPVLARHEHRDNRAAPTQDAGAPPAPQLSLEEMTQLILLLRQQQQLPQQQLPSTAIPSTLAAYGSYHPDVPAYDASANANALLAGSGYYSTEASAADLTLGGLQLNLQGAEAFVRLAALLQQPQDNGVPPPPPPPAPAQPPPEPSAAQPEGSNHDAPLMAEDAASKFLSLLSMQLPMQGVGGGGGAGVESAPPATAAPTAEMPEAEADMEVEPAQTPGRIILANPQPTAAPVAPTAPAPPKPQPRVLSVKAPTPPKAAPVKPQPVRATTPPSEAKPRAPALPTPAAAATTTTSAPITRSTVQRPPSTRTAPSESSLVIILDSASEEESTSDSNPATAAPASSLTAPLPAALTAPNAPASAAPVRSVALKSSAVPAAKAAAKAAEAQSEIERLRQLIAQKERELAKKRPVEEEATASKKVKSTPAPAAAGSAPTAAAVPLAARALSPAPGAPPPASTVVSAPPAPQQGPAKADVAPMDVSPSAPALPAPSQAAPVAATPVVPQPPAAQPAARASSAPAAPARSSSPSTLTPYAASSAPPPSAASAVSTRPATPELKSALPQPAAAPTPANPPPTPTPALPSAPNAALAAPAAAAQANEDVATAKPDVTRSRFITHLLVPAVAEAKKAREEMLAAARQVEVLEAQARAATQEAARTQAQARLASARTEAAEKREANRRLDLQLVDLLFELRLSAGLRALRINQELPIHANVAEFLRPYLSQMPPVLPSPAAPAAAAAAATPAPGTALSSNPAPIASAPSPTPTPPPAAVAQATTAGEQEAKQPRAAPTDSTQPPHFPTVSAAELVVELAPDDPCSGVLDIALSPFAALNRWSEERAARDEAEERQLSSSRSSLSRSSHVAPLMHATALPADYRSPLLALRAYRLQSIFPAKRTSATHSVRPDPRVKLCRFELSGACNDPACAYQHLRDVLLVGSALATDYASYAPLFASKADAAPVTAETVVAAARATLNPKQRGDTEALIEAVLAQVYTLRTDHRLLLLPRPPYEMPRKTKKRTPKSHVEAAPDDDESEEEEPKAARPDSEGFMALAHTTGAAIKERHSTRAADEGRYWMPTIATADYESMLQAAPHAVGLWLRFAKGCGATDDGLRALARGLEHNKTSTELWLAYLRLFLRLRCWQPEAAQLALNATRFNARDVLLARLAAQLARTVPAAVAILTTAAKALAAARESENRAVLLLTGAEALLSQGSAAAAQNLLAAAALCTPLTGAAAGEDALCAAAAPLAQHESVLLLLCACHVSLYGRMPVFPSGSPMLFCVPWLPTTSAHTVSWVYVAVADARLSGGESAAASALWANAVSLQRALGNAQRARALAAEATAAAPRVASRWVLRAKQEAQDGAPDAAFSVLEKAAQADPEHSVVYTLHSCVMRVQHGAQQPADAAKHLAASVLSLPPAEDARTAFLRVLALDADLAPVSLPASSDPLVWLSFALYEALREGAETEQVRAVFARALAQLRTDSARRLVQREYLCWVASRPKINGRMVLAELERIEVERDGLTLAVHFVATAASRLSATDALALLERVATALGEGSAVAMLALRCLDGGLQPPEVERVRQLVSSAATICSFDTTLWLALVRCAALYRKESLLLQTRAAMERAHPRFVALLDQLDARIPK